MSRPAWSPAALCVAALLLGCSGDPSGPQGSLSIVPVGTAPAIGAAVRLSAVALDAAGQPIGDTIRWVASPAGRAVIDGAGVLVVRDTGQVTVTATVRGLTASATVTGMPPGVGAAWWVGGASGNERTWQEAENWWPRQVPTDADSVVVRWSPWPPILSAQATVAAISLGDTARFTMLGDLRVNRAASSGGTITGWGAITVPADREVALAGSLASLRILGRAVVAATTTADAVTIDGGEGTTLRAALILAGKRLSAASLVITNAADVVMTNLADSLAVAGDVVLTTTATFVRPTQGVLRIGGDLVGFPIYASPGHRTEFTGAGSRRIVTPDCDHHPAFGSLVVAGPTQLQVTCAAVRGDLRVAAPATLKADILRVDGRPTTAPGSRVETRELAVGHPAYADSVAGAVATYIVTLTGENQRLSQMFGATWLAIDGSAYIDTDRTLATMQVRGSLHVRAGSRVTTHLLSMSGSLVNDGIVTATVCDIAPAAPITGSGPNPCP